MMQILVMAKRMLRSVATRGRIGAMGFVGVLGIVIGLIINRSDPGDDFTPALFLSRFGLVVFVPLVCLVFASSTLGNLLEEKTLVYFWVRPFGRWKIAAAAFLASLAVLVPLILIPMAILAAVVGDSGDVVGIVGASLVGIVGYSSVFTLLGAFTTRALAWGLVYILVWEGFIGGLSRTAGWFAIRTYTTSALRHLAEVPEVISSPVGGASLVIIVAVLAAVAAVLTTFRLNTMTVD